MKKTVGAEITAFEPSPEVEVIEEHTTHLFIKAVVFVGVMYLLAVLIVV